MFLTVEPSLQPPPLTLKSDNFLCPFTYVLHKCFSFFPSVEDRTHTLSGQMSIVELSPSPSMLVITRNSLFFKHTTIVFLCTFEIGSNYVALAWLEFAM